MKRKYQYEYENFKQNLSSNFLTLPPLGGEYKKRVIEKLVGELKLQNMIFKAYKNKAKSKR